MHKKINYIFLVLLVSLGLTAFMRNNPKTANFDFYVLSLSWSPDFCANNPRDNSAQCNDSGLGFVVHGLWPNYERGYPRNCASFSNTPSAGLISQMQDIMPSRRLVNIEWERHGTCSGLNPNEYFQVLRNAYRSVNIPSFNEMKTAPSVAAIEQTFIKLNPKFNRNMIGVIAKNGSLSEVRLCMDKSLKPRECSEVNSNASKDYERIFIRAPN